MLAIAWQYLTGRSVATHPTDRQAAEWPPHPDRVFQALVAAWGEGDADESGAAALRWLEAHPAPQLVAPDEELVHPGHSSKVYVPVNDLTIDVDGEADFDKKLAQAKKNAVNKNKDPVEAAAKRAAGMIAGGLNLLPNRPGGRSERYFPGTLVGDGVCALIWPDADPGVHRPSLERLCAQVIRIGHSRSLVRMWLTDEPPAPTLVPASGVRRSCLLRCPAPGRLAALQAAFAAGRRPDTASWIGYDVPTPVCGLHGAFDPRLIILRRIDGDRMFLAQAAVWTEALRGTLIAAADGDEAVKSLVSGHAADGQALQQAHAAYLPLAFVADRHADGHLLGLGIALPHGMDAAVEHGVYRAIAAGLDREGVLRLTAGRAGAARFMVEDRPAPPKALASGTWSSPHRCWSTVTPIVLDRQPPRRHADHDAFIVDEIARACLRQGLPRPTDVAIMPVSACRGAPPARAFPPLPRRGDGGRRWHVHAVLTFAEPVAGPLVLGAGRYRGYGFCRPGDVR